MLLPPDPLPLSDAFLTQYYKTDTTKAYAPDRDDKTSTTLQKHVSLLHGLMTQFGDDFISHLSDDSYSYLGVSIFEAIQTLPTRQRFKTKKDRVPRDPPQFSLDTSLARLGVLQNLFDNILRQPDDVYSEYEDSILLDRFSLLSREDPAYIDEICDEINFRLEDQKRKQREQRDTQESFVLSPKEAKLYIPYEEESARIENYLSRYGAAWLTELKSSGVERLSDIVAVRAIIERLQTAFLLIVYGLQTPMRLESVELIVSRPSPAFRSSFDDKLLNYVYRQNNHYFVKINDYKIIEDGRSSYVYPLPTRSLPYYHLLYFLTKKFGYHYLLRINEKDEKPQSTIRLQDAFEAGTGIRLSVDILRKIWVRHHWDEGFVRSKEALVKFALSMKHLPSTHVDHYNLDIPADYVLPARPDIIKEKSRRGKYKNHSFKLHILRLTRGKLWGRYPNSNENWKKFKLNDDQIFELDDESGTIKDVFAGTSTVLLSQLRNRLDAEQN